MVVNGKNLTILTSCKQKDMPYQLKSIVGGCCMIILRELKPLKFHDVNFNGNVLHCKKHPHYVQGHLEYQNYYVSLEACNQTLKVYHQEYLT
jgi:hypothetical protein